MLSGMVSFCPRFDELGLMLIVPCRKTCNRLFSGRGVTLGQLWLKERKVRILGVLSSPLLVEQQQSWFRTVRSHVAQEGVAPRGYVSFALEWNVGEKPDCDAGDDDEDECGTTLALQRWSLEDTFWGWGREWRLGFVLQVCDITGNIELLPTLRNAANAYEQLEG